MEMIVQRNAIYFYGQVKDLSGFLAAYPPETTLLDLINLYLN